jgi:hypothetical protein
MRLSSCGPGFESQLTTSLNDLDMQPYNGVAFSRVPEYNSYKPLFAKLYDELEATLGSRKRTVLSMEIDNWLDTGGVPDTDYSRLVQQFFSDIQELNALTAARGSVDEFMMSLHCHMYAATYELGAKRLVEAVEILEGHEIGEVGAAVAKLRERGYGDLVRSFDNKLRNGIAHNNYIVTAGLPPTINYANVHVDKRTGVKQVDAFSKTFRELQALTSDIMWCIMAGMHVHASRYVDAVRSALSAVV